LPVLRLGDPAQRFREIVLAGGILGMGEQFGPFAHEMIAPAHEIAGGPHLSRVDIGDRYQTSFEQRGNLMGIDFVVFAFAAMDGPHVEGMAKDERDVLVLAEVGQPVPGEHAFGSDNHVLAERFDDPQEDIRPGLYVTVQDDIPVPVEDADIHFVGVQVDSTVKFVLFGVKLH